MMSSPVMAMETMVDGAHETLVVLAGDPLFVLAGSWCFSGYGRGWRRRIIRPAGQWLFQFHLDFIRGISPMVALAGALPAGPGFLRRNLANRRLVLGLQGI